jgi:chemotaxis protein methyltransferase CheR
MKLKKYNLDESDFDRFRALINKTSGIYFDRGKRDLLRYGLSERAEAIGASELSDYYEYLTTDPKREEELRLLLNHLSVQETHFFRNLPQFDALRKYVIPELARRKASGQKRLKFWSAGCSTGQEPYSIAMSVCDVLPDTTGWDIQVLGTDLNESALDVGRKGLYPEKKMTGLDRGHIKEYFEENEGGFQARKELRNMIEFSRHNMVAESLPIEVFGTCDVIFCRNVIIYFTHQTAKHVIELFFDILNPGGYLFLGHSETLWKMSAKYSLVEMGDAFIYKKSLPRAINGRRFIADRRMREVPLPPDVKEDRRKQQGRRGVQQPQDLAMDGNAKAGADTEKSAISADEALEDVRELHGRCRKLIDLGEFNKAVDCLEEAVNGQSTHAESYYLLGLAREKLEDYTGASDAFSKAIYCDDSHSLSFFHLANVLEQLGRLKEAVREYRNASKSLSGDAPDRWEQDLEAFDLESLVDLCQWKIENLGSVEN